MNLTQEQLKGYREDGFVLLPRYFSQDEIDVLKTELPKEFGQNSPRRVIENGTGMVRSVYGSHLTNGVFNRLTRHPRLIHPAMQIVSSDVYVYQFKINAKAAFGGDLWEWHQDFVFWRKEDGLPKSRITNVVIFLDEVTEFNGPLLAIPKSHSEGVIDVDASNSSSNDGDGDRPWLSNLTVGLKYALSKETVHNLVTRLGIIAIKGPVGSALFFDANLVHASSTNISPFDRTVLIVSFNSVENVPIPRENQRPEFIVSRDCTPIIPLAESQLL